MSDVLSHLHENFTHLWIWDRNATEISRENETSSQGNDQVQWHNFCANIPANLDLLLWVCVCMCGCMDVDVCTFAAMSVYGICLYKHYLCTNTIIHRNTKNGKQ